MLRQAVVRIASGDADLLAITWRTLRLALESTTIAVVVGLPLAYLIGSATTRARRIALVLANAGLGLPPVALGVYLALLLITPSPLGRLNWTYTVSAIVLAQALLAFPVIVALTASAIRSLPGGLLDQARAFGASRTQVAVLALREARVGVMAAVIVAFGSAIAEVGAVVIVGGNIRDHTNTLASTVLLDLSAGNAAAATADVLVLLVLVFALGALLTRIQQRAGARWSGLLRPRRRPSRPRSDTISA
ncbi:MAG: tungstate transport system permease protein [Solirubrobacteraceae bacterium]|nr:tungstate transport system permease protein [Solirubrobacteraceae bacterium]